MISKLKQTVALAALLASASAGAAHAEGWYGRFDAGWSFDGSLDIDDVPANLNGGFNDAFGGEAGLDDSWLASIGAGYGFLNGFRVEGELAYRQNELEVSDRVNFGDTNVWSGMINGYYDFNRDGGWQPYVGLGIGAADVEAHAFGSSGGLSLVRFDDDDTVLAYQAMIGINIPVVPNVSFDVGYRYFAAPGLSYDAEFFDETETLATTSVDADYDNHALTVGLRWVFGAVAEPPPPPPPPPPPAPPPPPPVVACPTSEFVVYFEWDRSSLNPEALETIDAAVSRARECNIANVTVVGHTDTSGSQEYNQALSERRAGVVRDALVARGVDAGAITTSARGETELARQTPDGVREPLNRRTVVTITFR